MNTSMFHILPLLCYFFPLTIVYTLIKNSFSVEKMLYDEVTIYKIDVCILKSFVSHISFLTYNIELHDIDFEGKSIDCLTCTCQIISILQDKFVGYYININFPINRLKLTVDLIDINMKTKYLSMSANRSTCPDVIKSFKYEK